jgi:drug/metabolite transporter (DMT)-like permease
MAYVNLDLHETVNPWPVMLLFIAAATYALGTVLQERIDMPMGPMSAAVQMLGGGVSLVFMSALRGERVVLEAVHASAWLALAYLVVFGSILAYSAISLSSSTRDPRSRRATPTSILWSRSD